MKASLVHMDTVLSHQTHPSSHGASSVQWGEQRGAPVLSGPVISAILSFPICDKAEGLDPWEAGPALTPGFLAGGALIPEASGSQAAWEHAINSNCKFPPGSIAKPQGLPQPPAFL